MIETNRQKEVNTLNSRFKKDIKLQIHLHKAFFSDDRFLDSLHKSFLNQTTLDLRKEKWTFLNREFTVIKQRSPWFRSQMLMLLIKAYFRYNH